MPMIWVNGKVKRIIDQNKLRLNARSYNHLFENVFNERDLLRISYNDRDIKDIKRMLKIVKG